MAKNKTVKTENSVITFLAIISDAKRLEECSSTIDLINKLSNESTVF